MKNLSGLLILLILSLCISSSFCQTLKTKFKPFDTLVIEKTMGMKGKYKDGEYKVTIPQNDSKVSVDSFRISPPMGLSTWIAFTPSADGVMIRGDISSPKLI